MLLIVLVRSETRLVLLGGRESGLRMTASKWTGEELEGGVAMLALPCVAS